MNEDRIAGTARNLGGKLEEGVGRVTGDIKEQVQGKLDQAAGAAQDLYGQTADVARDTAVTFEKWLRSSIETKPYAAVECTARYKAAMLIGERRPPPQPQCSGHFCGRLSSSV
jgi:uncharacterized protein YjbJ (UPF0337 family)